MNYKEYTGEYLSHDKRSGTLYTYTIHVPDAPADQPLAVVVNHDGLNEVEDALFRRLAESGDMPPCALIGVVPGTMHPTRPDGFPRGMRFNDYDVFTRDYADFLVDELIPYVTEKHGLNLSDDPNMHAISGGSSGGISAWNAVWFRNDYFRRAYLSSPTFSAMARGNMAPVLARLVETKPIRVHVEVSENEPDDYFGSSLCAGLEGRMAVEFAGYDCQCDFYPGEGHCSRYRDESTLERVHRFLWKDWQTEPVKPLRLSKRAEAIVSLDEPWRKVDRPMPQKAPALIPGGEYIVRDNAIVLRTAEGERVVADGFRQLSGVAVSCDLWRLYIADAAKGCLYVASIGEDGLLRDRKMHASLPALTDFDLPGAQDLCVDRDDRIYAATELGVQCVRTFGLVDAILPLPGDAIPRKLALVGDTLYAAADEGVFARKIKSAAKADPFEILQPKFRGYYD